MKEDQTTSVPNLSQWKMMDLANAVPPDSASNVGLAQNWFLLTVLKAEGQSIKATNESMIASVYIKAAELNQLFSVYCTRQRMLRCRVCADRNRAKLECELCVLSDT